ncbi:MAG: C40 family peptidase [Bacteroidales bacterium]|nr:C40 family peptidase [Bacteroidales bacterium]
MTKKLVIVSLWLAAAGASSCRQESLPDLPALIDSVRRQYVPDKRDDVYEIRLVRRDGKPPVLSGYTSVEAAKTALAEVMRRIDPEITDSVVVLPDASIGESDRYGVINVSVADLRVNAGYDAEMATQLLLGAPVEVLQHRRWWRVRSAENYVAWITGATFVRMDKNTFNEWTAAKKIIFTDDYGFAYEQPDVRRGRVSDLVFGNLLKWEGDNGRFFKASYPDGRKAYLLKSQCALWDDWRSTVRLTEESIVRKALSLKGVPYSWGGTSTKMMDCSGFTKTVMLMHDVMLRRDASQQAQTGLPVDISDGYDRLRPGDLMFFGRKTADGREERIRHVAIYTGNREFIHQDGFVHISSLDPDSPLYDKENARAFIRATRIIGAVNTEGVRETAQAPLYQQQP